MPADQKTGSKITGREWGLLLLLAAVQFTNILDFVLVMPLGPQAMRELGIGPDQFGHLVAAYGYAAALASLFAARLFDRVGRKVLLLWLYAGFILATAGCGFAPTFGTLMAARALAGAFGGLVAVAVVATVSDVFADARRATAMGAVMSAFSLASIVGVPLGLLLAQRTHFQYPFLVLAALSLPPLAFAAWLLPPLRGHLSAGGARPTFRELLAEPNHWRAFAFMGALVIGSFSVIPYISAYYVSNVGVAETDLHYVYLFGGLVSLVGMNVIGRLADRYGKLLLFRLLAGLAVLVTLAVTHLPPVPLAVAVTVSTLFMLAASGRMVPAQAFIAACAEPRLRGGFLSLLTAVQHAVSAAATSLAAAFVTKTDAGELHGYATVGLIAAAAGCVSILIAGSLRPAPAALLAVDPVRADEPLPVEA